MKRKLDTMEIVDMQMTLEQFQRIHHDVIKLQKDYRCDNSEDKLSPTDKNLFFRRLIQDYHPLLDKFSKLMFAYDQLISKTHTVKKSKKWSFDDVPVWTEHYSVVVGYLWEFILNYDPNKGVYFTHYLQLRLNWRALDLWNELKIRNGISDKKHDRKNYKEVSYDELIANPKNEQDKPRIVMPEGITFDDNFEQFVFEWALEDPVQFVENDDLFQLLSTFTSKQTEAFALDLQGYKQEQIANQILVKTGKKITQQAVFERLVGIEKKIEGAGYGTQQKEYTTSR